MSVECGGSKARLGRGLVGMMGLWRIPVRVDGRGSSARLSQSCGGSDVFFGSEMSVVYGLFAVMFLT